MWLNVRLIEKKIMSVFNLLQIHRDVSSDMLKFKQHLKEAKEIVIFSGSGISAESGIPTFRGKTAGLWREYDITVLASPAAFRDDPGLVWEFYHYRREMVLKTKPNAGHIAIARFEASHPEKKVTVITQNIDGLHKTAGSKNIIELHGNLFKTRCTRCNEILINTDSPICEALRGRGSPTSKQLYSDIPEKDLPHCSKPYCGGLLRPNVVWFGEKLDFGLVDQLDPVIFTCNVLLVVGTTSIVYPAAAFTTIMSTAGAVVAEFNIELAPSVTLRDPEFYFSGPSATTLPMALSD